MATTKYQVVMTQGTRLTDTLPFDDEFTSQKADFDNIEKVKAFIEKDFQASVYTALPLYSKKKQVGWIFLSKGKINIGTRFGYFRYKVEIHRVVDRLVNIEHYDWKYKKEENT
jgi:hypothetical protein